MSQAQALSGRDPSDVDRALVRSIAEGSAEALASLYDRHASTVFGLAKRMAARHEDAEEIVQDVFAQVWRQAARYRDDRASVAGWLVMLTRTRAIDRIRARNARPDLTAAVSPESAPSLAGREPDPEQAALTSADVGTIRRALEGLPDGLRALVDLAYFEGLTHSEIAARTATPLGTVKTRLRTAMFTLREAIRRESPTT